MKYKSVIGRNTKLSTEEVKEYVESFDYKLLSEYETSKKKILVQCPNGHEPYYVSWGNFKTGKRCPKCKFEKLSELYRHDDDYIENYIRSAGYEWLDGEYINGNSKLILLCPQGHEYTTSFSVFHNGFRCPHCNGNAKLTYEYIKNKIENEGFILLSDSYINSQTKLELCCDNGHEFEMNWNHFQQGERCPMCHISYGIQNILSFLNKNDIDYKLEYKFTDCKNINSLPFDIFIPELNTVIEFDGEQHYHEGAFGNDVLDLMNIKYRDNIKNIYCHENNITIIRIPYWDITNIENILKQFF